MKRVFADVEITEIVSYIISCDICCPFVLCGRPGQREPGNLAVMSLNDLSSFMLSTVYREHKAWDACAESKAAVAFFYKTCINFWWAVVWLERPWWSFRVE